MEQVEHLFLSRRNLQVLLSKLDRKQAGDQTHCAIIKRQGPSNNFRQTAPVVVVAAVEDDEYYGAQDRPAGDMHPADTPK